MQTKALVNGKEISRLSNKIRRELDNYSAKCEYSGAESKALHFLLTNSDRDIFQKDIEDVYGLRPATASQLLKKMEQSGLIIRESVEYDARLKKITVTKKAMEYQDQMIHDLNDLEKKLIQGIDQNDLDIFSRVLSKMIQNLS